MSESPSYIHKGTNQLGTLSISSHLPICRACGTQFDSPTTPTNCRICDDPRQYVPPTGQSFTTLCALQSSPDNYHLTFTPDEIDPHIISIRIHPQIGIGQRAILIRTPHGNILWDLICYLDAPAISHINSLGGLSCIVISHPHFYTTWRDWSRSFNNCPVYVAGADKEWLNVPHENTALRFLTETESPLLPGVTPLICGGHFPGSLALHTLFPATKTPSLFHADTIHTVPNAHTPDISSPNKSNNGHTSYSFMWSIPNNIPLSPYEILGIWRVLRGREIEATYGFVTVRWDGKGVGLPERILGSMRVVVGRMGSEGHEIMGGEWG